MPRARLGLSPARAPAPRGSATFTPHPGLLCPDAHVAVFDGQCVCYRLSPVMRIEHSPLGSRRTNAVRGRVAIAVLTAALALVGCKEPTVSLGEGTREYVASDYPEVLDRWTRSASLISLAELDDMLTATATYESWDFRWSYVIRYAQDYRLTIEQRRDLLDRTLAESRDAHQFYVALYGTKHRWADLSKPSSGWIVRLIDERGTETAPASIEKIRKPGPLERTYFPYSTVWRHAFRIRFPIFRKDGSPAISPQAKWFGLRFAGAQGNQELRWKLDDETRVRNAAALRAFERGASEGG